MQSAIQAIPHSTIHDSLEMWFIKPRSLFIHVSIALFDLPKVPTDARWAEKRNLRTPFNPPPKFQVQANNPDFPDEQATIRRLHQAWIDMWHLAAVACVTLDENEDVYERYFEPGESEMVRYVFCNIAGIKNPATCNFNAMGPVMNIHMQDLTIVAGLARPDEIPPSEQPDLNDPDLELFCTTFQDRGFDEEKAYTQVYKRAFDFPTIEEIFRKRSCSGLGAQDSGLMTSLGAHLLHEMMHWRLLTRAVNNQARFDVVIPHTVLYPDSDDEDNDLKEEHDYIDDYNRDQYEDAELDPPTGYGPKNAHDLVVSGGYASFRNADNYRWYAVSKYWSLRCTATPSAQQIVFTQQNDNQMGDQLVPQGCNGQIPCP